MSTKHTPGPWHAGETYGGKRWVYDRNNLRVCKAASDPKPAERAANERLIAAAPDYAEAFERLCAIALDHGSGEVPDAAVGKVAKAIAHEYSERAAIKKARGQ